jgi:hypothetical protein
MNGFRRGLYGSGVVFTISLFANQEERESAGSPDIVGACLGDAELAAQGTLRKEVEMLLHLPIAILSTLSPFPVADAVPKLDIAKECRFEGGSTAAFGRCSRDEAAALQQLEAEWPQFAGADRSSCFTGATAGGLGSYVDLLICLEMARDVRKEKVDPRDEVEVGSTRSARPEMGVLDKDE